VDILYWIWRDPRAAVRLARLLSEGFIPGVGLPRGNLRESSAGLAEDGSGAGPPAPRASSPAGQRRGCSTSILPQCVSPARSTSSTSWRRPRRGRASSSLQPGSGRVAGRRSRTRSSSRIPCRAAQGVLNVYLAAMWHRQRYRRRPRRGRASSSLQPGSGRVAGCDPRGSRTRSLIPLDSFSGDPRGPVGGLCACWLITSAWRLASSNARPWRW
jgi:hypothetical protein